MIKYFSKTWGNLIKDVYYARILFSKKESGINIRPVVTSLNPIYDHYNFVNELYIFFIIISHVLDQVSDNTV